MDQFTQMACREQIILLFISLIITLNNVCADKSQSELKVIHEWKTLDFNWASQEEKKESIKNGTFIEKNNAISGIKLWKDRIYLSVPRQRAGVPATLTVLPPKPSKTPLLEAFPSWAMQKINDCSAFQFVQSFEIDTEGRMWVIDAGVIEILEPVKPPPKCPPKLVIIDLNSDNFPILRTHIFPDNVVSHTANFLNDIVVDNTNGWFAYMSDLGINSGIAVYSFKKNKSWKVHDKLSMSFDPLIPFLKVNDVTLTFPILALGNVDGIALSPASGNSERTLYYCPLVSFDLYSVSTKVLQKHPAFGIIPHSSVTHVGRKNSATDGMMMDSQNNLYFGLVQSNEVAVWNTKSGNFSENYKKVDKNDKTLIWPDGFAIDESKNLYVVTNKLQNILVGKVNTNKVNYRISKKYIGNLSYQH